MQGFNITVESCERHIAAFEEAGQGHLLDGASMFAFANESPVEHGFGDWDLMSQSSHPTTREYGGRKGSSLTHSLRKHCQLPISLFTSTWSQYQTLEKCNIKAEELVKEMEQAYKVTHPAPPPITAEGKKQLKESTKLVRQVAHLASQQKTQNTRAKYKHKTGFAPPMIIKVGEYTGDAEAANAYMSFKDALNSCRAGNPTERLPVHLGQQFSRSDYMLLPGDMFFVESEGEEDEDGNWTPAPEGWWAAQQVTNVCYLIAG